MILQFAMALRRRFRGLAPEEALLEQICLCQRGINIGSLSRCKHTSCCGVFMHKVCHCQMMSKLPTCENWHCNNDEYQREVVLETDEEGDESDEDPFSMGEGVQLPVSRVL